MSQKLKLSEERKGQIVLIIFKKQLKRKQLTLDRRKFLKEISDGAEQIKDDGVTKEELIALYEEFVREAVAEMFDDKKITIVKKEKEIKIVKTN